MSISMDTLVDKITIIEEEARQRVASAEAAGKKEISQLTAYEIKFMEDFRLKAENKAEAIINEKVQNAKRNLNLISQEEEQSIKSAHQAANKNKSSTLQLAQKLFIDKFMA
jgi:vacuolar-type H+-ATPase subunit H